MKKTILNALSILLVSALILTSFLFPLSNSRAYASVSSPYKDVPSSHWAFKYIVKMNSREVVAGYQDRTFKPDNAVTQLEAVLMAVRNMEAESEIARIDASRTLPWTVPDWALAKAKKELLFAVDKGLIVPSEKTFYANSLATRAWMTQLMIRMIGKDSEAALYANQHSGFNDDISIPTRYRGYINAAVNYEIIAGFADKTFKPNAIVTRAQSVVMLSKCEKYMKLASSFSGKIINIGSNKITFAAESGTKIWPLSSSVLAFDQNGSLIPVSSVKAGSKANIIVKNGQVKLIEISEEAPSLISLYGKVIKIKPESRLLVIEDEENNLYTKTIAVGTPCNDSRGNSLDFSLIPENAEVELSLDSTGQVVEITVLTGQDNLIDTGIIVEIDKNKQLIIIKNGSIYNAYKYSPLTEVEIDGVRFASVNDLMPGDEIKITTENNIISKIKLIKAQQNLTIKGSVVENLYDRKIILIETADKKIQTFPVSPQVKLVINGIKSPILSDIVQNDNIEAVVENGVITSITVTNRTINTSLSGTVVAVDVPSRTLVLKDSDEDLITYEVSRLADIKIDGKTAYLSDVKKDMKIRIELLGDKIIYIENSNNVNGTVISVNTDRSLISIKDNNGNLNTYKVSTSADIQIEDITRAELRDLKPGDEIEFKVTDEELVTEIKVKRIFTYEILSVYSDSLKVTTGDGDYTYIYDEDNPEIIIPGISYPRFSDFKKGNTVKVTYMGFKVVKIELSTPLAGQITDIDTYSGTITIATFEGKTTRLSFNRSSKIIDSGKSYYSLRYLHVGDRIKVQENSDGSMTLYLMKKVQTRFAEITDNNTELLVKRSSYYTYTRYDLVSSCYVHKGSQILTYRDLKEDDLINIYILDDMVYEIEKI
ncbi:S-layer homology domain-containing protein [Thermosyntropha sp.]|uniref:S-layer homology domain-containing protein n=1 Tax=Thermosyntropha sp. TaxID=2740820 RepID=UPI0025E8F381|nr:S-layer homology domain-containing protein [Thermosyntropha sp.]MBO8159614.1 S-layer homology domain-containing protein [Thermosyntropha sp.]